MRCLTTIPLLLFLSVCAYAQPVHIPDPNLRAAVRAELKLPADAAITQDDMNQLTHLTAYRSDIINLSGLESATQLETLVLGGNPISDLRPLAVLTHLRRLIVPDCQINDVSPLSSLRKLVELNVRENPISDLTPVVGLTELKSLDLGHCLIVDISSLAHLIRLEVLQLNHNQIVDVRALANLTSLYKLEIDRNFITNHSPLDSLTLDIFVYDQVCDIAPLPLHPRLEARNYPLIVSDFGIPFSDRPHLSFVENLAQHDLIFAGPEVFGLRFSKRADAFPIVSSDTDRVVQLRDEYHSMNPNIILLTYIEWRSLPRSNTPHLHRDAEGDNWPYWLRDEDGNIIPSEFDQRRGFIDFTHPHVQDRIVHQAVASSKCGLFDGIIFDYWNEHEPITRDHATFPEGYLGNHAEQRARDIILSRIRAAVRPDFLILGNTNYHKIPRTKWGVNGGSMESSLPGNYNNDRRERSMVRLADSLLWLDTNTREPRLNIVDGVSIPTEPFDSPSNLRWMRALTTLSLTHANGYVSFDQHRPDNTTGHWSYDFWDADLGQPVGAKGQLYQDIDGLYIREFTNGWAVYNHSGAEQTITLPELASGVASRFEGMEHTLPNLDGEMYLRVKPANPADVNGDGVVNILDLTLVAQGFGTDSLEGDVNGDGVVNVFDLVQVAGALGGGGAAPSAYSLDPSIISAADVARWLAGAQGLGVGGATFQQGIRFLEQLLAALTPKETTLLPNYPNPFNPETWIPYRLAQEAEVAIAIYDTKGTLVRRLALGNQAAGYYAERGKAAYWDGRNEGGEAVASGIYIYQFRAGDYAASRRMVIVK